MAAKKRPASRYSMDATCVRIVEALGAAGMSDKALGLSIDMSKDLFSRKKRQDESTFSLEELGQIADYFEAPVGWPVAGEGHRALIEKLKKRPG